MCVPSSLYPGHGDAFQPLQPAPVPPSVSAGIFDPLTYSPQDIGPATLPSIPVFFSTSPAPAELINFNGDSSFIYQMPTYPCSGFPVSVFQQPLPQLPYLPPMVHGTLPYSIDVDSSMFPPQPMQNEGTHDDRDVAEVWLQPLVSICVKVCSFQFSVAAPQFSNCRNL